MQETSTWRHGTKTTTGYSPSIMEHATAEAAAKHVAQLLKQRPPIPQDMFCVMLITHSTFTPKEILDHT